jgi:hypothetical protein
MTMKGVKSPAAAQSARIRNMQNPTMFGYRGYKICPKGTGWKAEHVLWQAFPRLPLTFLWHGREDKEGICAYIDCLYRGEEAAALEYEKRGQVHRIVMPDPALVQPLKTIKINIHRLISCLQLTDTFEVPAWSRISFTTDGTKRCVPADYIAALVEAWPEHFGHLDPSKPWRFATEKDLKRQGVDPASLTTGSYLHEAEQAAQADAYQAPPPAPAERTIRRLDRGSHIDWVTEVRSGEQVFYARRLYRDTRMLYEATAWSINGPWHVSLRDNSALLALGITL